MAKITAWLVTIIGVLMLLPLVGINIGANLSAWLVTLAVLVIGVTKLNRNYSKKRR